MTFNFLGGSRLKIYYRCIMLLNDEHVCRGLTLLADLILVHSNYN